MSPYINYSDPDTFRKEATIGHTYTQKALHHLQNNGIKCHTTPLTFAPTPQDRKQYTNEKDIILHTPPGCIEIKSRRLNYTNNPQTYPYPTAFVDTQIGWDLKNPKPLAVILISQKTDAMLVIPTSTHQNWKTTTTFDRIRKITETWYIVDKELLRPIDEFVEWLQRRQERAFDRSDSGHGLDKSI